MNTLEEHWNDFVKVCIRGSDKKKIEELQYTFYSGAIAYRNIIAKINDMDRTEENEEKAMLLITDVEMELKNFIKE